jgi:3-deoxy-manno-octulosonate cytidylyltransferase (CMP-KDO synthetase)
MNQNAKKTVIIIPARLDSIRLPEKIIADIGGLPMVIRVARQALLAAIGDIFIACCSNKLAEIVGKYGFKTIITDPELKSGTDRVYAALKQISSMHEYIINLQGDMPFIDPEVIHATYKMLLRDEAEMTTAAALISDSNKINQSSVVKAILTEDNRALYFTRAPAPFGSQELYEHIGIYGYKPHILEKFVQASPTKLEYAERLEQLRALENGIRIEVALVNSAPIAVDTADDLAKARAQVN